MFIFILISIVTFSNGCWAALGDRAPTMKTEHAKAVSRHSGYTIRQYSTPVATIKEYVDTNGTVVAVSWHGFKRPNLSNLLGRYYDEYHAQDAVRPRMITRHPVVEHTPNIMVYKAGHMRDVRGFAYLPTALSNAGLRPEDLK